VVAEGKARALLLRRERLRRLQGAVRPHI